MIYKVLLYDNYSLLYFIGFPNCCDKHEDKKFCGTSLKATLTIDNNQMKLGPNPKIMVVGEIRTIDGGKDNIWLSPGSEIQYKELLEQCEPKNSRYFADQTIIKDENIITYKLEFNANPRSWQYGFNGNRWASNSLHGFIITVLFAPSGQSSLLPVSVYSGPIETTKFVSINQYKSNGFELHCARISKKEKAGVQGANGQRTNKRKLCTCSSDNSIICVNPNHNIESPQKSTVGMIYI
jgi:hypothetical protein